MGEAVYIMWVIRNKQTKELVSVANHKPPIELGRDEVMKETPWEYQIDPEIEEIVELPGDADDIHSAIEDAVEASVGEDVQKVIIGDDGVPDIHLPPGYAIRDAAKQRLAEEAKEAASGIFLNTEDAVALIGRVLYKAHVANEPLDQQEIMGLTALNELFVKGVEKKNEVDSTPLNELDDISWNDGGT